MKQMIIELILFILSITFCGYIYIGIFKISAAVFLIFLIILILYGFCMSLAEKSKYELKKYEKKLINSGLSDKDDSKVLFFSLLSLLPTYFCIVLVSMIPMYTHEVWFITVFPCILLNCLPAGIVLDEYYCLVHKKLPFFATFILLTVIFCFMGITVSGFIIK